MASASDVIVEALREAITRGDLKEGETLRQDQIARMFKVSRIPVREALARLEAQGLVVTQRYRGATVASLSSEEIEEIYEFRALLEPEVIRRSVRNMQAATVELAATHCEAFAAAEDPSRWGELNRLFHYTLYQHCGRPYYLQVINAAIGRIERYQRAQLTLTDGMKRAHREHLEILTACKKRDADLAAELIRRHILGAGRSLIDFIEQQHKTPAPRKSAHAAAVI
jgi:DNA-binding GntR family transcriptional regulator